MRGLLTALLLVLGLGACGYRLVGQSADSGVIPEDTAQIVLIGVGNTGELLQVFRQKLRQTSDVPIMRVNEVKNDDTAHSIDIRMENASESMTASAFDASGIANQYRVTISASLRVLESGKELWVSDVISVSGDVFASGGAVAIEAQKMRVMKALRDEWAQKSLGYMRSGF